VKHARMLLCSEKFNRDLSVWEIGVQQGTRLKWLMLLRSGAQP
jgi:hypothetical protein